LRAEVEYLARAGLNLGGWRARRCLGEEFRFFEQRDKPPGIAALAAQQHLAVRLLALARRLELELREPSVIRKDPGHVVQQLHGARERIFLSQREVVVAG
jgi:hypothetical protein